MKAVTLLVSCALVLLPASGESAPQPPTPSAVAASGPPSLQSVRWAGTPMSFERLQGKSVAVFVYATWCPKCNVWSGELLSQIKQSIKDKPVVVLAINADEEPSGVKQYLADRAFSAPNIIHGWEPTMHKRLGFESTLFVYALYGPDGTKINQGYGGSYQPTESGKDFSLAKVLGAANSGTFQFIKPEMSEPVKALLWPCEFGTMSDGALRVAQKGLSPADRKTVDAAFGQFLDGKLEPIEKAAKGAIAEKLEAYDLALGLSASYKSWPQAKKARDLANSLDKDAEFKRELLARKAYQAAQTKSNSAKRRETLMRTVAQRFGGTHYGDIAAQGTSAQSPEPKVQSTSR